MINFLDKLIETGLRENEAKIYLELLRKGELSANELSKNLKIDRTLSYSILNSLIKKGLANYIIKNNKKYFSPASPDNLLNTIKKKEIITLDLIPHLSKIKKIKESSQEVNIYEGKNGIRTLFELFLKHNNFLSFGVTGKGFDLLYESPVLAQELSKKNVAGKIIISQNLKHHPLAKIKNIKVRYSNFESEATTTIFGDYVSIYYTSPKILVILIKDKTIANTYRKHFKFLWDVAKKTSADTGD